VTPRRVALTAAAVLAAIGTLSAQQQRPSAPAPFKSGVELINVTATVSDATGRFVSGLTKDDFTVFEDDRPQEISYFSADRVPVSLGLIVDTSGSMAGEKMDDAKSALNRFVYDLLDERDEVFLYRFSDHPMFIQGWTSDRDSISRAIARIMPNGGTALYDAVLEAAPYAATGHNQKKALVLITDGNDTSSIASLRDVRDRLRDGEVLVYAVGIDGDEADDRLRQPPMRPIGGDMRVNSTALHDLTDDSGGRTEIVRTARDLDPATTSIADELSKQYALGYSATGQKDGRWHSIRVEVRNHAYRVRARRGYVAS
jgi:Ca-activated chloride channel family protein